MATATHAEDGVSSTAPLAARARPATAKRCQFVGISNENRLKNSGDPGTKVAMRRYNLIMNAP